MNLNQGKILNIDKPYGWGSTDVVRKLKGALRKAGYSKNIKIGHAGTLDPLATGVLLVCVGKATKLVNTLQEQNKEYTFQVTFGATTPSYDLEHPVDQTFPYEHITESQIKTYLTSIIGQQEQIPPIYSAKKIDGKRAYQYARDDKQVTMRTANITIYAAQLIDFDPPCATLKVECSKGTYVRSIARDIGAELQSGAHLATLRRTKNGGYEHNQAMTIEQAEKFILDNPNPETSSAINETFTHENTY